MSYKLKDIILSPFKEKKTIKVTSDYGKRKYYNKITKKYVTSNHRGIDLTGGKTIVAVADGKVISIKKSVKGYSEKYSSGNYVTIAHNNNISTVYCHMKYGSITLKKNSIVKKGDYLGIIGSTGKSTGKHLHFAVKKGKAYVNPKDYLLGDKKIQETLVNEFFYIVKKGDTLSKIAKKFQTTWKKIYQDNLSTIGNNPNLIKAGQELRIRK